MEWYNVLSNLINDIYNLHINFSKQFYTRNSLDIPNLKKYDVKSALKNEKFLYLLLPHYLNYLKLKNIGMNFLDYQSMDYTLRTRDKSFDTIIEKINHYVHKENNNGSFYVSKTLNDLMGFRIVIPNLLNNKENLYKFLEDKKNENIISRYYNRNDGNYHAIHCYFQMNNRCFPWELQIWDSKDEDKNSKEHGRHEKERRD